MIGHKLSSSGEGGEFDFKSGAKKFSGSKGVQDVVFAYPSFKGFCQFLCLVVGKGFSNNADSEVDV